MKTFIGIILIILLCTFLGYLAGIKEDQPVCHHRIYLTQDSIMYIPMEGLTIIYTQPIIINK